MVSLIILEKKGIGGVVKWYSDKIVRISIHPEVGLCAYQKMVCIKILTLEKEGLNE